MTTFNTGNPVPSTAAKDLYDNAENLDLAINGDLPTWIDRKGRTRKSVSGAVAALESAIDSAGLTLDAELVRLKGLAQAAIVAVDKMLEGATNQLSDNLVLLRQSIAAVLEDTTVQSEVLLNGLGYLPPVAYESNLVVDSPRFTVSFGGNAYAPNANELPFTTGEQFLPEKWRLLQGVSGADLASATGSAMVGYLEPGGEILSLYDSMKESVTPRMFGALPGVVTPAQALKNVAAINKCLARAAEERRVAVFPGSTYSIDTSQGPVLLPSRVSIRWNKTVLQAVNDNAPIVTSKNWWDGSSPGGSLQMDLLEVSGTGKGAEQHGIILRDYYFDVSMCRVRNVGGRGIVLDHRDRNGVAADGSLVEPRIRDCEVSLSGRACFYLGANNNSKITDGFLINPIARLAGGAAESHIYCGSSAGWKFDGYHTYGGAPTSAMELSNCFNTRIGSGYIEAGWTHQGLNLPAYQAASKIDSLAVLGGGNLDASASAVRITRSTAVASAVLNIGSLELTSSTGTSYAAIRNDNDQSIKVSVANEIARRGDGTINLPSYLAAWFSTPVSGLRQTPNGRFLHYLGYYGIVLSRNVPVGGGGQKVCTLDIPHIALSGQACVDVCISARQNNNANVRATYIGKAFINAKGDGDAWVVRLVDLVPASGFATSGGAPVVTVMKGETLGAERPGILTVAFEFASTDAYGACHLTLN